MHEALMHSMKFKQGARSPVGTNMAVCLHQLLLEVQKHQTTYKFI